ncbi:hypothetical protein [Shimwellia blattae]|uniref:Phage protein n=1 Tax=Shimwellia blattae (strain ATCC 29907 / DSM 4481 / JCM 1650 / NBRC 105725 / CDC 9005-74) TaxID=630626 RepID=I2B9F1_SHIBC|nr:hypothetical protein [Shimwellia blattae]AFJ47155.1 hypothetical protein EBL_c20640 [Shimwellia blattae DSM 4481 = NBRC 105725]GAB80725.1 hypothetical protein EB105725_08_00100 [Shimwellia blattae DSM 4481 = NBRC 105725]VDY64647.1 Uncharacterised protein [Shimwellia blattae]VEC22754.1 Uncharacterised protein [Shimwellia blattae]
MYLRNDLTLALFYASGIQEDTGYRVATITAQVCGPEGETVQQSQLQCITDASRKKHYSVGAQSIASGSDPLLVAIECYWRDNPETAIKTLMGEVMEFIASNISQTSTWIGQYGMKVLDNEPLVMRMPEAVLNADGGVTRPAE